eukprot:726780-Amphidinium_carterae.1
MDRSVPVEAEDPEVLGPRRNADADGDTRMTCKKCGRYVTTYKGTWRNLGTIAKQPCRPKARRQKGREGKAPSKQSGGALPALPRGSRPRGRAPGPNKKLKRNDSRAPLETSGSATQNPEILRAPEQSQLTFPKSRPEEPGGSSDDHKLRQCALCRGTFSAKGLQSRVIREQIVQVCGECFTAHPKTIPKFRGTPKTGCEKHSSARDAGGSEEPPAKRSRSLL